MSGWGGGDHRRRHEDRRELAQYAAFVWLILLIVFTGLVYGWPA